VREIKTRFEEFQTNERDKIFLPLIVTDWSQSITGLLLSVADCGRLVTITGS